MDVWSAEGELNWPTFVWSELGRPLADVLLVDVVLADPVPDPLMEFFGRAEEYKLAAEFGYIASDGFGNHAASNNATALFSE